MSDQNTVAPAGLSQDMLLKLAEVSRTTPKISDLVLFLGRNGGSLIDNAKHCYLESVRNKYPFKSVFYTSSPQAATELALHKVSFVDEIDFDLLSRVALVVCDDFHWRGGVVEL